MSIFGRQNSARLIREFAYRQNVSRNAINSIVKSMSEQILTGEDFNQKKKSLKEIRTDESDWNIYFQDENFKKWVQEYPNSENHGGGQPQLRLIKKFPWEENPSKEKYKLNFEIIRKLLNEFDPCSLMKLGAPIDEYDDLVNKILSDSYNNKTKLETTDSLLYEIQNHYGLNIPKEEIENFRLEIENFLSEAFNKIK